MAEFEGEIEMIDEKTQGETKNKFQLTDNELDKVSGGYFELDGPDAADPNNYGCYECGGLMICGKCPARMTWGWNNDPNHQVWDCFINCTPQLIN